MFEIKAIIVIFGICMLVFGVGYSIYIKIFNKNCEKFEGTVTALKPLSSKDNVFVYPVVEYSLNGKLRKAHLHTYIPDNSINFKPGDVITIVVNPRFPSVFRLENNDILYNKNNKTYMFIALFGLLSMIIGIII